MRNTIHLKNGRISDCKDRKPMGTDLDKKPSTLVLDVGKTNVKLLVMSKTGRVVDVVRLDNQSLKGPPYPHLDTERIWRWLLEKARGFANQYVIDAIVPTTHGSAAALVHADELVLPILDYETEIPEDTVEAFRAVMPTFEETQSPDLPGGLSLGRQLFWLQQDFAREFSRAQWMLTYPQYWAWRLSGIAASEVTSISCHSHLWCPQNQSYSSLVEKQGWHNLFPPIRPAYAALRPILTEVAQVTGLSPECKVYNGIHDANAAYSLFLRGYAKPFSLLSTGTWVVLINPRLPIAKLNEHRDTMALADLRGKPLPMGRFMGGREFEILSKDVGSTKKEFAEADVRSVIAKRSFLLPSFATGGPFMAHRGSTIGPPIHTSGEILARATLYLALMTMTSARILQLDGDLIITGGFINNPWYCQLVATLTGCQHCFVDHQSESTALGAGMLPVWNTNDLHWGLDLTPVEKFEDSNLFHYAEEWQQLTDSQLGHAPSRRKGGSCS